MDIAKLKAQIEEKRKQQEAEWNQTIAARKKADAEAAQKFVTDMEKATKDYMSNYGQKLFGQYWKQ